MRRRKEATPHATRRRWTILLLALVLLPALFLTTYALTARWLLSGPKLRGLINENPESLTLDYDEATSLWPGRIRIRNLRIRGSDQNVQWIIRLGAARIDYSVLALLGRRFRTERVLGTGLSFRIRNKLTPSEAKSADLSILPPVPGFADPPLRSAEAQGPEEKGNPWRVDVRGISIDDFEEIWIDAFHYEGAARVAGSFFLRPGLLARIGPARVTVASGRTRIGKVSAEISVSGTIFAAFDPYEPDQVHGSEVWRTVQAEVKLDIGFDRLESLEHLVPAGSGTGLEDGRGEGTIRGTVEKGIGKGEVRLAVEKGSLRRKELHLRGDVDARFLIPRWDLVSGPLEFSGSRLALSEVRASGADESRRWWGRLDFPFGTIDSRKSARIEAQSRDARPLLALFTPELPKWTRGLLELEDFRARATVGLGTSYTRIQGLDATGGSYRIRGEYLRDGAKKEGAFLIESDSLSVGLELVGEATKLKLLGAKKWFEEQRQESALARTTENRPAAVRPSTR